MLDSGYSMLDARHCEQSAVISTRSFPRNLSLIGASPQLITIDSSLASRPWAKNQSNTQVARKKTQESAEKHQKQSSFFNLSQEARTFLQNPAIFSNFYALFSYLSCPIPTTRLSSPHFFAQKTTSVPGSRQKFTPQIPQFSKFRISKNQNTTRY